jgi:two-component system, cell cycle response regulator DivK
MSERSQSSSGPVVLLVEDFADARAAYVKQLREHGYVVEEAVDGQEAIDKAVALQPSLVLMDLSLPAVDGWEATRRLKADPRTRHIPVIALTAHTQEWHRRAAFGAGCDGYLTKPLEMNSLLFELERTLTSSAR